MNPMNKGIANGIDGWRLDVAYDVGSCFLERLAQNGCVASIRMHT